jgi:hypothetical protein
MLGLESLLSKRSNTNIIRLRMSRIPFIHIFFFLKSQVKKIVYETLEYYSQNIKTKKTLTRCETC